ncbi:MAG: HAMP domain-containing histidine kinase [Ruminococcus sp.]|uniref:histidine kinase n=1 Tax=Schaedlerella arabinosiphila TaxID=2044587 RepID=A0A426DM28_9FIRM|nr:HAMP domain-containing sensor histidine kinase [Schaedlerella arabinosiphila]MCI8724045.1 HAMP domain-containing histidine kinase [Ruminococcus sp.]RRK33835.1 sensor histidine kinase [Schaedlerella arabinosiphila]
MNLSITAVILICLFINLCCYLYYRRRFIRLSSEICRYAEQVMGGRHVPGQQNQETITSKVLMELEKLETATAFQLEESKKQKKELQEMISEITHQIKTPLSNLKMYCEMLSEEGASFSRQSNEVMKSQLIKLEFLLDTLLKASRLETDMIRLEPENSRVLETLAAAVNNVMRKAELKNIEISVDCRPSVLLFHDRKWTAEAIENILDNAVKYTPENGSIHISVHPGEMYTEIRIQDTGKGIAPAHINDIFKRFYREKSVSQTEGLGLGLYLARYIIALQKGYISVRSTPGKGSRFSVCLPKRI